MPRKQKRRAEMIALGRMVVYHVQDDLDAGGMEGLDHGLEFADQAVGGIAHFRGKKADGVISPVIFEPLVHEIGDHRQRRAPA